jgi:pyrimidine-nucleoside phosphorylase
MRAVEIIRKKRDGCELSRDEIGYLVREYSAGRIPDYQLSAFLMAVFFQSMTTPEVAAFTEEMRVSGEVIDLAFIPGCKVDKHSTGGVGDKTSLVLAPAVAAAGVTVPMMSGRGLGHTGGTLDKLESIPGFEVRLSSEKFKKLLATAKLAFIGQTENIVPADRKLYALRDVTATVESRPLITASIMSKKLAEGIDGLVLDVKTGSGAFMKAQPEAEALAEAMVNLGKACGKKVVALVTDMNQPLGNLAGNSLEVIECLDVLKGGGPADLVALCTELSAHCLVLGEAAGTLEEGRKIYRKAIESGKALEKFREVIGLQGGDPRVVEDYGALPTAKHRAEVSSATAGFVGAMETEKIGLALCVLGAGRETVDSVIDPAVGVRFHKKIGDAVAAGEALCTVYYNDEERCREARRRLLESYVIAREPAPRPLLVKKTIT